VKQAFLQSKPLPPVQVVQVEEDYFVIDGHHRVSAARQLGVSYLEARVHRSRSKAAVSSSHC
jgi:ParB-like chromosome segregation protein Spo0J